MPWLLRACGANYRLFIDWLPAFEKSQPLAITKVHQELANVQLQADRPLCGSQETLCNVSYSDLMKRHEKTGSDDACRFYLFKFVKQWCGKH